MSWADVQELIQGRTLIRMLKQAFMIIFRAWFDSRFFIQICFKSILGGPSFKIVFNRF